MSVFNVFTTPAAVGGILAALDLEEGRRIAEYRRTFTVKQVNYLESLIGAIDETCDELEALAADDVGYDEKALGGHPYQAAALALDDAQEAIQRAANILRKTLG